MLGMQACAAERAKALSSSGTLGARSASGTAVFEESWVVAHSNLLYFQEIWL